MKMKIIILIEHEQLLFIFGEPIIFLLTVEKETFVMDPYSWNILQTCLWNLNPGIYYKQVYGTYILEYTTNKFMEPKSWNILQTCLWNLNPGIYYKQVYGTYILEYTTNMFMEPKSWNILQTCLMNQNI